MDGPLKIYAPLILLPLLLSAGISGSQENYLMELWAVTCILAACAWPSIRETQPRAAWLILLLQLGLFFPVAPTPVYQPYQFENLNAASRWSSRVLHEAIAQSVFSAVLIKGPAESAGDPTFNPDTQALIDAHYILHRVIGPWHLYRPK